MSELWVRTLPRNSTGQSRIWAYIVSLSYVQKECSKHGLTDHAPRGKSGWRCRRCTSEYVTMARKKHRQILLEESGSRCGICGYDKYSGALQFHHKDPTLKSFTLSGKGQTYSLARKREEAAKCILLCANCHAEVEGGITIIAP